MRKVLLAWEYGAGLGHVGPLRAIGSELAERVRRMGPSEAAAHRFVGVCNRFRVGL